MSIRIWFLAVLLFAVSAAFAQTTSVIKSITVIGNKSVSQDAILAAMRTKVGQPYVQATLDQDKRTLEELGFFQAVDVRVRPVEENNIEVTVEVQEWPVVKEIRVVGNKAVSTEEILKLIDVEPGKIFNARAIQPGVKAIEDFYAKKGFFAQVEEFGPLRDSPETVNISIIELTVNSVGVQGNTRTKTRVLQRLIKTRAGDPFSQEKWLDDLRRLYSTGWFEEPPRSIANQPEPGKLDLIVDLKEGKTGNLGVGLQVDPRSSFAGFLRLSDSNFNGTGQSVGLNFLQGTRGGGPSIDLDYGNPFIDNRDTSLRVSLYSRLIYRFAGSTFGGGDDSPTEDDRYYERRTGGAIGLGRPINRNTTGTISTRYESIETSELETNSSNGFIQQDGQVGSITFGVTRNRRDVDIEPARGDWFRLELEPGYSNITRVGGALSDASILGSNTHFKGAIEYRAYFTDQGPRKELDDPRRVLAIRARYGFITGEVPFFEQFFAGGSDSLRGYEEDRFWGKNQLLTTAELRIPIQKGFNLIGFVDYGGAWGGYGSVNDFTQSDRFKLHLGYGVGASFRTPLGPLRLDLGIDERGKTRTHFQISTSF